MAAKNENRPAYFDDDLAQRCFPHRFRRVGSPYAFLSDVGIDAIVEYISKGHLLIDVAEVVNVPLMTLREWVQNEGHLEAVDEAETLSAEGYLAEGMRKLRYAKCDFELKRAKEMIRNAQYMAGKKNKPIYGEQVNKEATAPVTYIFNVPGAGALPKFAGQVIDATTNHTGPVAPTEPKRVSLDLGTAFGIRPAPTAAQEAEDADFNPVTDAMLAHLLDDAPEDAAQEPTLVLVADRPANPTADEPDIGPFFDYASNRVDEVTP